MPLDEELRLPCVPRFVERPAEFGESDLDLGVPADRLDPAVAEDIAHQVGGAARDVDETVVGSWPRAVAGDGRLEQVPEAVQLVAPFQVRPPRLLAGSAEHRVEVAIGFLSACDAIHEVPEARVQGSSSPVRPISHASASRYL